MRAIVKSAKTHAAAKKCCGWEESAICPDSILTFPAGRGGLGWVAGSNVNKANSASIEIQIELKLS